MKLIKTPAEKITSLTDNYEKERANLRQSFLTKLSVVVSSLYYSRTSIETGIKTLEEELEVTEKDITAAESVISKIEGVNISVEVVKVKEEGSDYV